LLSGLWHGASWNFVLWGAYNGLFLTLDRMFLRRLLDRCGTLVATTVTLLIVMMGWAIFRIDSPAHLTTFVSALFGMTYGTDTLEIPSEVPFALVVGAVISLVPAMPLYGALVGAYERRASIRLVTRAALVVIYVLSIARAVSVPFQPFIYFRF